MLNASQTCASLNRLSVAHSRSLTVYLQYAPPWLEKGNEEVTTVLEQIVSDQEATADRISTMIQSAGEDVDPGKFPISFTGLHDLSSEYLVSLMIESQREIISISEQAISELAADAMAQAVAQESLGAAKAHLDSLLEIADHE
tara:strand:- start:3237 stop:3665 length:429 start_codon:yes stop_codon:yes gene_type:complete